MRISTRGCLFSNGGKRGGTVIGATSNLPHINPHTHIPLGDIVNRSVELNKKQPIIVMCHTGVRSAQACEVLTKLDFDVYNLDGGIDMWSKSVDPTVPIY